MAKIIHSMIRVLDLERSINFYKDVLNMKVVKSLDFSDFSLVYLRNCEADFEIELTLNKGRTEPYSMGDGYGHIAIVVDDLLEKHQILEKMGYSPLPIKQFTDGGKLLAKFFFIQDPDGYKIEILERHGHYK
jgi:lactoylglutathione lyase